MDTIEIRRTLTELFQEIFDNDALELRDDMTAADVSGWDSLKMVLIVIAVQNRFQIKLTSREVGKLEGVGDLLAVIASKLGAKGT